MKTMTSILGTLKSFQEQAKKRADDLLEEAQQLEEYANNLQPVIDMVEKMPDVGASVIGKINPPPDPSRKIVKQKERIYSLLTTKQLTITEISKELSIDTSWVSRLIKEDEESGILEKYDRFDGRKAVRVISEKVRQQYGSKSS